MKGLGMRGRPKRVIKRSLTMMLAILLSNVLSLVGPLSSVAAFAATSGKVTGLSDQGLELSYTGDGDEPWTASGTTIKGNLTATKGTCQDTDHESSLTIKNNKSSEATLSFSYSPELNNGTATVDGASVNGKGTFSKSLQPGESITIHIKTKGGSTKITLTDIKLLMLTKPEVTFSAAEHGSYTVDGQVVSDTLERSKPSTESYHLVATADPGYRFLGWYDAKSGSYLSSNPTFDACFDTDANVSAQFVDQGMATYRVNSMLFADLDAAVHFAQDQGANAVYLHDSGTLSGSHVLPAGITLVIPMDDSATFYRDTPNPINEDKGRQSCYRKLTLEAGSSLRVNGAISLAGSYKAAAGSASGYMTGPFGQIQLDEGSSLVVQNGGSLYAWGFVTGDGSVTVESGAKAYEWYQIADFRGGSASGSMGNHVFPFSQYYVQNIEAPMTVEKGGSDIAYTGVYAMRSIKATSINFIGDDGLFKVVEGSLTRRYDGKTDRIDYEINGNCQLNNLKLKLAGISVNSSEYVLPITNNMTVGVEDGGSLTVNQDVALLPGVQLRIAQGGTVDVSSGTKMYVYDADEWDNNYVVNGKFKPVVYSPTKTYSRKDKDLVDARIDISGKLVANGEVYTTKGGAALVSTDGTGVYEQAGAPGTEVLTYQYTQDGANVTAHKIPVTSAQLMNADGSFTPTADAAPGTSIPYMDGVWKQAQKTYTVTWVDEDGTVLGTDEVEAGATAEYKGDEPTKAPTDEFEYAFSGWTPEVGPAFADVIYKATYKETRRSYTITWKNADGTVIGTDKVLYGEVPVYSGDTPTKQGDQQHSYAFAGWKAIAPDGSQTDITAVTGDATYTATFTESVNTYTVTWKNDDGTVLQTDKDVPYGTTPEYKEKTPKKAADAQFTYSFKGWTPEVSSVTGDVTYTATYEATVNQYTVTWQNEDGTVIKKVLLDYGTIPAYSGVTPSKQGDAQFSYAFKGWDPEPSEVTGDATYTAQFEQRTNEYTVRWLDDDGNVLKSDTVRYGEAPVYTGETPTKANDEYFKYTFSGWNPSIDESTKVTANVDYRAQFQRESLYTYTVTFDANGGEGTMEPQTFASGVDQQLSPNAFTRNGYVFKGWNTAADGTGVAYAADGSPRLSSDLTLYAQWSFDEGWYTDEIGKTYYMNGEPAYHNEWQTIDGVTYYFKEDGYVATGIFEVAPQGETKPARCAFAADGAFEAQTTGVYTVGSETYWLNAGIVEKYPGLKQVKADGQTIYYYFGEDGLAVKGGDFKVEKNNGLPLPCINYHFLKDGVIEHDPDTTKNGMCDGDGSRFYYIDGIKVGLGLFEWNGGYYYARTSTGEIIRNRTYWVTKTNGLPIPEGSYQFDAQGRLQLDGWVTSGGRTYYYAGGSKATGLTRVGDDWYLFNRANGNLYKDGTFWVNENEGGCGLAGGLYRFDAEGKMVIEASFVTVSVDGVARTRYRYADGTYAKGLTKVGDDWYLFNRANGNLYKDGTFWVNENEGGCGLAGGLYRFDAEGKLASKL